MQHLSNNSHHHFPGQHAPSSSISASLGTNAVASAGANKSTLFLGDLSAFCSERDIHDIFSPYGEVVEIKIMRSEETHRNLSYGFLKFASPTSAKKALNGLNGILFCGRHLRVGWASYKNKKEPKILQHHDRMDSSSVHVSFMSFQLNSIITEESLRILFSSFGVVLDTSIKKSYIDEAINRQCGYGFVHFASSPNGIASALASVSGLHDATIEGVSYKCSVSHNLEKQLNFHRPSGLSQLDQYAQHPSGLSQFDQFAQQHGFLDFPQPRPQATLHNSYGYDQRSRGSMNQPALNKLYNHGNASVFSKPHEEFQRPRYPHGQSHLHGFQSLGDNRSVQMSTPFHYPAAVNSKLSPLGYEQPHASYHPFPEPRNVVASKCSLEDFLKLPIENPERDSVGSTDSSSSNLSLVEGHQFLPHFLSKGLTDLCDSQFIEFL